MPDRSKRRSSRSCGCWTGIFTARRMPQASEAQRSERLAAIQLALRASADVQLGMALLHAGFDGARSNLEGKLSSFTDRSAASRRVSGPPVGTESVAVRHRVHSLHNWILNRVLRDEYARRSHGSLHRGWLGSAGDPPPPAGNAPHRLAQHVFLRSAHGRAATTAVIWLFERSGKRARLFGGFGAQDRKPIAD